MGRTWPGAAVQVFNTTKRQKTKLQKNNIWIRMMNDECDSASNRALILRKTVEQAMPAEATECDQTTTKCKNYGRQVGQRKVKNFLLQIFLMFEDHAVLLHIWGVQCTGDLSSRLQNFGGNLNFSCGPDAMNLYMFTFLHFYFFST